MATKKPTKTATTTAPAHVQDAIDRYVKQIRDALKMFGTYTYDDKGPNEVMDVHVIERELRAMSAEDAASVLRGVCHAAKQKGRGLHLATTMAVHLQDWEALFEQPGVDDILNFDMPGQPRQSQPVSLVRALTIDEVLREMGVIGNGPDAGNSGKGGPKP
jgi:hypothetical protein